MKESWKSEDIIACIWCVALLLCPVIVFFGWLFQKFWGSSVNIVFAPMILTSMGIVFFAWPLFYLFRGLTAYIKKKKTLSNPSHEKGNPRTGRAEESILPTVITIISGILIVFIIAWLSELETIALGIGGLLLLLLLCTGIGAVIVAVILFITGKPIVSIFPLLLLGLKTFAVIVLAGILLCAIFVLTGSKDKKEIGKEDKLEDPMGSWDCPKCSARNQNTTFSCLECGYSLK